MNPFFTHQTVLRKAVEISSGPVLELGTGWGSTPMLHELCKNRLLISVDHDENWICQYEKFKGQNHIVLHCKDYSEVDILLRNIDFSVVLVDHAPAERRIIDIIKMLNVPYVVVHDTHDPAYGYELIYDKFKYRYQYKELIPYTSVLSNVATLEQFHDLR